MKNHYRRILFTNMKKALLIYFFTILCGVCMAKTKIISSEPCEYRDVSCDYYGYNNRFKEEVSFNQALEDLDMLVYLLKTAYVAYEDAVKRGLKIEQITDLFKKAHSENETIKVADLSKFITDYLAPYIQDCHFCVESKNFRKSLVTQHRVLYSNVFVKKIDDSFVAEKSDNQNIKIGETLECGTENLFLYPSEGNDIYRLGTYALMDEKEKQIQVMISENKKQILCNVSNNYLWTNNITAYKEIETEDSLYIYIPTLMDLANNDNRKKIMDEHFENLRSVSARYPEKKNIIIDLRTNGGGNSRHTSKFLANLYFLEKNCNEKTSNKNIKKEWSLIGCNGDKIDMISPSVFQAEQWMSKNVFSQDKFWLNEIKKRSKILDNRNLRIKYSEQEVVMAKSGSPKFKGKMIILTGKNTCSSGELAILEAKNIFSKTNQFFQIGENSGGCYAYGNVWCYQLINSGIALHLACFRSPFSENCPEGLGFIPGYWATNDDILKAIVNVTGDEELSEKLVEINSDL